jgi:hypothetical protein
MPLIETKTLLFGEDVAQSSDCSLLDICGKRWLDRFSDLDARLDPSALKFGTDHALKDVS